MKTLTAIRKFLILVIIQLSQNTMMIQTNQSFKKMRDETGGVAIKEFVELKLKMHSFLVDDNSEHKKAKSVNRNVVATTLLQMLLQSHKEYNDILQNNQCLRQSINRTQSKGHRISLSCFDDKIYIQNNGYDA